MTLINELIIIMIQKHIEFHYQHLINKNENVGKKHLDHPISFVEYSNEVNGTTKIFELKIKMENVDCFSQRCYRNKISQKSTKLLDCRKKPNIQLF